MPEIDIEVVGLIETQKAIEQKIVALHGQPMLSAMRDCTLAVLRGAKQNLVAWQSPSVGGVDRGTLRASIVPEVTLDGWDVVGITGSALQSAPFAEVDTRPHWPPIDALEPWASRHGASAFLVARAISRRGTKGKKYLERATNSALSFIRRRLEQAVGEIMNK